MRINVFHVSIYVLKIQQQAYEQSIVWVQHVINIDEHN